MIKQTSKVVLKAFYSLVVLVCIYTSAIAQKVTHSVYSVYFAPDKFTLNDETIMVLDRLLKEVNTSVDYALDISANTDADGTNIYNDALSWKRAKAVEAYILSKGGVVNKCHSKGLGENDPLYTNNTEIGKAGNRRVDVTTTLYNFDNIEQVMAAVNTKAEQRYTIDTRHDNVIKGKNGTIVNIPSNAFQLPNGTPVKGNVDIELKEALNTNDIFFADLSTTSDEQILQTGGMINLEAKVNGAPLVLNSNKSLTVSLPTKVKVDGMELFYGEKTVDGKLNWKPAGQKPKVVELKIDLSQLNKIKLPAVVKPQLPHFTSLPKRPHCLPAPIKPYMPRQPVEIKYIPHFFERIFSSKESLAKKESTINKPYITVYEERMERYYTRLDKYAADTVYYREVTLPKYRADSLAYLNGLSIAAQKINKYVTEYINYFSINHLQNKINEYLNKPLTSNTKFTLPTLDLTYNFIDPSGIVLKYLGKESIASNNELLENRKMFEKSNGVDYLNYMYNTLMLMDGSLINLNTIGMINEKIYAIADSSGLLNQMNEYDRKILEATIAAGAANNADINKYVFTVSRLNWINCDHFIDNPNPVMVKINESEDAKVMIVCNNINSIMQASKDAGFYTSPNIPTNTNITIVSVKLKDGHLQMAIKKAIAGQKKEYNLEYNNCTLNQLKEQLRGV